MKYEQIKKEFEEIYFNLVKGNSNESLLKTSGSKLLKSFLKQSFIKYLQEQLEVTKRQQADPFTETEDFLDGFALCKSQTIATLEAQIKELGKNE
jgi:hypothetical protein